MDISGLSDISLGDGPLTPICVHSPQLVDKSPVSPPISPLSLDKDGLSYLHPTSTPLLTLPRESTVVTGEATTTKCHSGMVLKL